jgi:2,3-bisphosphoglycerate-dependent phosphoglycerate mutase
MLFPVLTLVVIMMFFASTKSFVRVQRSSGTKTLRFMSMKTEKYQLVLVRHGESTWNDENKFTGWYDCPLSKKGEEEAIKAGQLLKENKFKFDLAYTSYLQRAIKTLWHSLEQTGTMYIPIKNSWQLNER